MRLVIFIPAVFVVGQVSSKPPAQTRSQRVLIFSASSKRNVRAAAGSGEIVFEEAAELHIALPRSVVPDWARLKQLICIRVVGDSMMPTLNDGDMLLLDRSHNEPMDGKLSVIYNDDGLLVKRLHRTKDGWELVSDNLDWSARMVVNSDRIIGLVAWWGALSG